MLPLAVAAGEIPGLEQSQRIVRVERGHVVGQH